MSISRGSTVDFSSLSSLLTVSSVSGRSSNKELLESEPETGGTIDSEGVATISEETKKYIESGEIIPLWINIMFYYGSLFQSKKTYFIHRISICNI